MALRLGLRLPNRLSASLWTNARQTFSWSSSVLRAYSTERIHTTNTSTERFSPENMEYMRKINDQMLIDLPTGRRSRVRLGALDLELDGYTWTADIYRTLMNVAQRDRNLQEVLSYLHRLKVDGHQPKTGFYNLAIRASIFCDNLDVAFDTYADMRATGIRPSPATYGTLLSGCANAGDLNRAHQVVAWMEDNGMRHSPETAGMLIRCYANAAHLKNEEKVEAGLKKDSVVSEDLAAARTAALEECTRMLENSRNFDPEHRRVPAQAFHAMLGVCNALGDGKRVLEMIDGMEKEGLEMDTETLHHLVEMYVAEGNFDMAKKTLTEQRENGVRPKIQTYMEAMEQVLAHGEPSVAIDQFLAFYNMFQEDKYKLRGELVKNLFPHALNSRLPSLAAAHEVWNAVTLLNQVPLIGQTADYLAALKQREPHLKLRIENVKRALDLIHRHHEENFRIFNTPYVSNPKDRKGNPRTNAKTKATA